MTILPKIERIAPADLSAEEFFAYVAARRPVIFTSCLDDDTFHAQRWTPAYLREKAGSRRVTVEPISPHSKQFGSSEPRIQTTFAEFLDRLEESEDLYLTTQYEGTENEEDVTTLAPPCDALIDDFPLRPRILGNLLVQQVNLWYGRSQQGRSSGLHHDHADNLYILLKGRKRFVVFPPQEAPALQPMGDIEQIHPNGLISYAGNPLRSDGLVRQHAVELRIEALDRLIERETRAGNAKAVEDLAQRKEDAEDELMASQLENHQGEGDDLDALGLDDDLDLEGQPQQSEEDDSEGEGPLPPSKDAEAPRKEAPDSFSRISASDLHAALGLVDAPSKDYDHLRDLPHHVIELREGEMLYLPASWWHEVTSQSSDSTYHAALNYWLYPPDALDDFPAPYEDKVVFDHLREMQRSQWAAKFKRPRDTDGEPLGESSEARKAVRTAM